MDYSDNLESYEVLSFAIHYREVCAFACLMYNLVVLHSGFNRIKWLCT